MSHEEVAELLGAFALDSVEGDEREAVDQHLRECRVCAREVAEHRDTAGFLAPGWVPAPDDLWDRIAGSLEESPPPLELAPVVPMTRPQGPAPSAPWGRSGPGTSPPWGRSGPGTSAPWGRSGPRRLGVAIAAAAAVAAVAVIGVLGFKVVDEGRRIDRMEAAAPADKLESAISAAQADPAARRVALRSSDGRLAAEAVMLPDGSGYLTPADLPRVGSDRTYQLWAVVGPSKISVGVLGPEPGRSAFRATADVSALAITEEPAGGVIVSDQEPVGVGTLS